MNKISWHKGIALFLLVFVLPAILAQPFRPVIAGLLPQPTLWQSLTMFVSTILVSGLAIYAYNLREDKKELEREVERVKYRADNIPTDD